MLRFALTSYVLPSSHKYEQIKKAEEGMLESVAQRPT